MIVTVHSNWAVLAAQDPEWRLHRHASGLTTEPTWTGEVNVPDTADTNEFLFAHFNRATEADCARLEAMGYTLPSLSVGDTVTWGGSTYRVAPAGFEDA